jgi:indole-3-glycerol phosphate synthase
MSLSLAARIRQRQQEGALPVVSEIKVHSPKEGDLLRGRAPAELARTMAARPIAGISVVTESEEFGGSVELLREVAAAVDVPILCKDFFRSAADVAETRAAGASAILLTVAMLEGPMLSELHATARALGLETLAEIHDQGELEQLIALGLQPSILGINNRDILVLETDDGDVSLTETLAALVPAAWLVLSESAIGRPDDARRARDAGADAVLVGTSILQAPDTAVAIDALIAVGWAPRA